MCFSEEPILNIDPIRSLTNFENVIRTNTFSTQVLLMKMLILVEEFKKPWVNFVFQPASLNYNNSTIYTGKTIGK